MESITAMPRSLKALAGAGEPLKLTGRELWLDNPGLMSATQEKPLRDGEKPCFSTKRASRFASLLLREWKRLSLPLKEARLLVAVSGGADSVALFLALDELIRRKRLALSLTIAHLDHGLRAESARDARWVESLADSLGYESEVERVEVKGRAEKLADNLEQAARGARYEFLERLGERVKAHALLTAHTLDDQAETVLLRLLRGSGAEGLGGMEPVRPLNAESKLLLVRPLLNWAKRVDTEDYCRARAVEFRADTMNEDEAYARVRVRKRLIPLLQSFNSRVVEGLARTAQLLREDARVLDGLAARLLEEAQSGSASEPNSLSVEVLSEAPRGLRLRALRLWLAERRGHLRRLEMVHLLSVERLLEGERGGRYAELPGGTKVSRRKRRLIFHAAKQSEKSDE